jgi:hypothetical protein
MAWAYGKIMKRGNFILGGAQGEEIMRYKSPIGAVALVALGMMIVPASALDEKYPDWSGQWKKPPNASDRPGNPWDQTRPIGRGQEAPLTPEYQAIFEASLAAQERGAQGENTRYTCSPSGMPRVMTVVGPIEFVILPTITYIHFENNMPRRIYTDGRDWPKNEEPGLDGYSIGKWVDRGGTGRYDMLEVETRNFKGPRQFESSGLPLHADNQTIVKERLYLDKASKDIFRDEITTIDDALTRPWTVLKTYLRSKDIRWLPYNCNEYNSHVVIGKEDYFLSADGYLMPVRKDQAPPDLRYFKPARK